MQDASDDSFPQTSHMRVANFLRLALFFWRYNYHYSPLPTDEENNNQMNDYELLDDKISLDDYQFQHEETPPKLNQELTENQFFVEIDMLNDIAKYRTKINDKIIRGEINFSFPKTKKLIESKEKLVKQKPEGLITQAQPLNAQQPSIDMQNHLENLIFQQVLVDSRIQSKLHNRIFNSISTKIVDWTCTYYPRAIDYIYRPLESDSDEEIEKDEKENYSLLSFRDEEIEEDEKESNLVLPYTEDSPLKFCLDYELYKLYLYKNAFPVAFQQSGEIYLKLNSENRTIIYRLSWQRENENYEIKNESLFQRLQEILKDSNFVEGQLFSEKENEQDKKAIIDDIHANGHIADFPNVKNSLFDLDAEQKKILFSKLIKQMSKKVSKEVYNTFSPAFFGGIAPFALFNFINSVSAGYGEEIHLRVMRDFAKYVILPLATITATNEILEKRKIFYLRKLQNMIKSGASGINLAAFLTQFAFFVLTMIVEKEDGGNEVDISNTEAWGIIAACLSIGGLEILKSFYNNEKNNQIRGYDCIIHSGQMIRKKCIYLSQDENNIIHYSFLSVTGNIVTKKLNMKLNELVTINSLPSLKPHILNSVAMDFQWDSLDVIQKALYFVSNNRFSKGLTGALNGAAIAHNFTYAIELATNTSLRTNEQYIRYGATVFFGLSSMILESSSKNIQNSRGPVILDYILKLMGGFAMGTFAYDIFTQANAKEIWGEEILKEQEYGWLAGLPLYCLMLSIMLLLFKNNEEAIKECLFHYIFVVFYSCQD